MNKLLIALFCVLPAAPALAQGRGGPVTGPQVDMQSQLGIMLGGDSGGSANSPSSPLPPGLHLQVVDGAIVVTNSGGSQGFNAGQFGFVPSASQPPVLVPSNPGIQFVPPPSFSGGQPPPLGGGNPQGEVDCVVR